MTIELRSPLSPEALQARFRAATDPESAWGTAGRDDAKAFRGTLVGRSVAVRLRGQSRWIPVYGPEFTGVVEADAGGSLLRGDIGQDHTSRGMAWFGAIFGLCMVGVFLILAFVPRSGFGFRDVGVLLLAMLLCAALARLFELPQRLWQERLHEALRRIAGGAAGDRT